MRSSHRVYLSCQVCGKEFSRPKAHFRNKTHSCSRECARKIRPTKAPKVLTAICRNCGRSFQRTVHRAGKMMFCSPKCQQSGLERPSGKNHPHWKGGVSRRTHAENDLTRRACEQIGKCERCGSRSNLHGHHKVKRSKDPSLALSRGNIEVLCASCHALEHPEISGLVSEPHFRKGTTISCIRCGQIRYVKSTRAAKSKFCSRQCYWASKRGNGRIAAPSIVKRCRVCGVEFQVRPHRAEIAKVCSRRCAAKLGALLSRPI